MANVLRFANKTIRGTDFWKTWDYFFGQFFHEQLSFHNGSKIKLGFP